MVLKLPLTSAALTKGRQRYRRSFCVWPLVACPPPPCLGNGAFELAFGSYWPPALGGPAVRAGDLLAPRFPPMLQGDHEPRSVELWCCASRRIRAHPMLLRNPLMLPRVDRRRSKPDEGRC